MEKELGTDSEIGALPHVASSGMAGGRLKSLRIEPIDRGKSTITQLQYELYPKFLSEEAQLRSEQNRHLEESEIWYIVWALTEVAGQCAANGEKLRDISPDNIFMNSAGNIKVLTPFSLPNLWDPYFDPSATDVYFSPE